MFPSCAAAIDRSAANSQRHQPPTPPLVAARPARPSPNIRWLALARRSNTGIRFALAGADCSVGQVSALGGEFNWSVQHSNLLAEMECGHEAATSHLLFCGSAV